MTSQSSALRGGVRERLHRGVVIPAHPLALGPDRRLDVQHQTALTRYYLDAGAGGVAVGVHTTQFGIRREQGMYEAVLRLAREVIRERESERDYPIISIAGVVGETEPALREAQLAKSLGYDLVLLGLGGLSNWPEDRLVGHVSAIADVMPVMGFYLQPSVGGMPLSYDFWRSIADLANVEAIKIAPFNRYQTLDVVRAVSESHRRNEIALYTGNDDNIVADLLTVYRFMVDGNMVEKRIVGGLLGHWAVWTKRAVELLHRCHEAVESDDNFGILELLTLGQQVTDSNAAIFDSAHCFAGCIPGIHEILRRQKLMLETWCLDPHEQMSVGQVSEIDRVEAAYPHLSDTDFVADNLQRWLRIERADLCN